MKNNKRIKDINDWITKLRESKLLIIVEGIKDKNALIHFGIQKKRIITLIRKYIKYTKKYTKFENICKNKVTIKQNNNNNNNNNSHHINQMNNTHIILSKIIIIIINITLTK